MEDATGAIYEDGEGNWVLVPKPVPMTTLIRGAILNALAYTHGNQTEAAAHLGITVRVMGYHMDAYDIPRINRNGKMGVQAKVKKRNFRS